jgi:hypothetical protein
LVVGSAQPRSQPLLCQGAKSDAIAPHDLLCFGGLSLELRIALRRFKIFSAPLLRSLFEQFLKRGGLAGLGLEKPMISFIRRAVIGVSTNLPCSSLQLTRVPGLISRRLPSSAGIVT